jgi:TfoX/Sxy family transcriptional regulator of competence genes
MFGGVGFFVYGNMACGVIGSDLIVRVGTPAYEAALTEPFVRPFDFTGRPMKGWITVESGGSSSDQELSGWVTKGVTFAQSLPKKK